MALDSVFFAAVITWPLAKLGELSSPWMASPTKEPEAFVFQYWNHAKWMLFYVRRSL
jgi:hypothetical protein